MNAPMQAMKVPPHSFDAEKSTLGTMLIANKSIHTVMSTIDGADFYKPAHAEIYRAICDVHQQMDAVDLVTVSQLLRERGMLDAVGGIVYLSEILSIVPSVSNVGSYCRIIKQNSVRRTLITMAQSTIEKCYDLFDIQEICSEISQSVVTATKDKDDNMRGIAEITDTVMQQIRDRADGKETGIPTGFADIDRLIGGLQNSDLILIAARPSMGKTTFAMNIAQNVAKTGKKVLVFSLEMSREKLVEKQLSTTSRVSWKQIQRGVGDSATMARLDVAAEKLRKLPIVVDDTGAVHIDRISAKAQVEAMRNGVDLIVVDYIGLSKGSSDRREREISEISAGLKALAKKMKIPVVALSQLSRKCEERPDKRPMLSDLRDSGSLEQDGDVIAFIYREEQYDKDPGPLKGIAEVIIRKNRCGETGVAMLRFDGDTSAFYNLERREF